MSKYAKGESKVKEIRNADFFSSLNISSPKKSSKKQKKKQLFMEWIEAAIGATGLIAVALIQKDRSEGKKRREADRQEHDFLIDKVDSLGTTLGISIDRVETNLTDHINRVENTVLSVDDKLNEHIRDHALGSLLDGSIKKTRKRSKV